MEIKETFLRYMRAIPADKLNTQQRQLLKTKKLMRKTEVFLSIVNNNTSLRILLV